MSGDSGALADRTQFDGRVVIVTGAGRGIGAGYAELLAARGAKVVVNDLGGSVRGAGADHSWAETVVDAITSAGGTAVADTSDISTTDGAAALVAHAVDRWGRLDAVVNNAGIYWTDGFPDIELEDLLAQWSVHVAGSFAVTRAAWPHLRASGAGRVVMTTSTGALGSASLTAYGSAKAAVLGLGRALAQAGEPDGIKVNVVAPMAMTRMMNARNSTVHVPDDSQRDPALVAPLVALLCHPDCPTNGETYVSGMRRVTRLLIAETAGYIHHDTDLTIEDLREHWNEIVDPTTAQPRTDTSTWSEANNAALRLPPLR